MSATALTRQSSLWTYVLGVIVLVCVCTKHAYRSELVTYLQQEKALRMRMTTPGALNDSIAVLQRYYNINLEEEYRMLTDNPELWLALLKDVSIAK